MLYDLVIKNGWVVDGSGSPRYRADVGVIHGRIATVGRIRERAREVIDADGQVVAPGFVDGHTHMDAQVFWDPLGTCSCWHGVTTVVMGNCGFTLAPCAKSDRHLVMRNLERAEDIAADAMEAGIDWRWTTFAEFLDCVESLPKGINYAGYIGHSALRTYVMGERAFEQPATEADLQAMERELRDAIRAGAIGFTTSRSPSHETPDRRPVASRLATWDEVRRLVGAMGEMNAGIFELAGEAVGRATGNPDGLREYHVRLRDLAVESGRPVTWGLFSRREAPEIWRAYLDLLEETAAAGGRMFAQVHSRALAVVLSFKTNLPFDRLPVWKELRALPLAEQQQRLRDPALRRRLVEAAHERDERRPIGAEPRAAAYDWIFVMDTVEGPHRSVAEVARQRGVDPVEAMIDLALERNLELFFLQPIANEDQDHALELIKHPRTVVTFSDSGAHVSQIMDASLQTHLLSHWVRAKQALTLEQAVRMLAFDTATHWGFSDRGLIRGGFAADLVVFDPETIGPEMPEVTRDLPAGARRLVQKARGISTTVVNGEILLRDGKHTGALPGRLLRGGVAARV
ncbi:MAG TPA: amidohydrolase family protein [Methylomirabilota bacterium]|jgi:N-acyl-D-aspartate/D-glutamate deacylase|nr:amidohydrolase family protein [Methylomirabilota bacterium]